MLNYDELADAARMKRLSLVNTEKDYLQDVVLLSIYSHVGDELVFKGGTCLYKVFGLNRFSEDLDFTLAGKVGVDDLADKIVRDVGLLNIKGAVKETKKYANEINVRLIFNGPLYKGGRETQCFIPLNISLREKPVYGAKRETIKSMYTEIPDFDVFAMHEEEILVEKVRAVMTRNKPRDVYDLWFLLKRGMTINREAANRKLKPYGLAFDTEKLLLEIKRKRQLWNMDLRNLVIGKLPDFDEVVEEISAGL